MKFHKKPCRVGVAITHADRQDGARSLLSQLYFGTRLRKKAYRTKKRKLSAPAFRTIYDANCQHQRFESIITNLPHIKYVLRIWKRATDIWTSQSYRTGKWNTWKLDIWGEKDEVCKACYTFITISGNSDRHNNTPLLALFKTQIRKGMYAKCNIRERSDLCILDTCEMIIPLSPLGSQCLLLFTIVHTLQNVTTIIRVFCYIYLQNLFTCRRRICCVNRSYITSEFHFVVMLLAAGLKTTFRTQFLRQFSKHLPHFIFLDIITTYYNCKFLFSLITHYVNRMKK